MGHEYTTWAYRQDIEQTGAKFVLVCIADAAGEDGRAFPGQKRLGRMTSMGERTVRRHAAWLEERGYLKRTERRRKDGSRTSDEYHLPPKDAGGQIGRWKIDGDVQIAPHATGQRGRLSVGDSTGQKRHVNRPTLQSSPANLAGHEPPGEPPGEPPASPPTPQQAAAPSKPEPQEVEEVNPRTPPRNGNQIQGLMQRHPTTWEALCRVKNDREWKRAQFQAIAGRVYRLAELHGERECTAALTDLLVAGDQVRHPLRWLEAALTEDPPATKTAGGKDQPRSTLLEELRAARSSP